ncbi:hypothetical protein [Streptosporangium carneum]|uniref:Spore-associated protein A n=1 Tax=Streptosporangium carneum TaxID=47481 RepID=A0A9W6MFP7_9ACTN|nr:hypothetical protein [Streptosporangium carneum]GLK12103.1 hypothetical protein GCM10017600_55110 [Streptosporangium carneum]
MITSTKTVLLAAALAAGGLMAGPAHAATAAAASSSPESVCGSGFGRVGDGSRPVKTASGKVWGHVYLLYNRTTGYNCVATIKTSYAGRATYTSVTLQTQTRRVRDEPARTATKKDAGQFKYYAGPIKLYAKNLCVKYWGVVKSPSGETATGGRGSWGNCG